MYNRILLRGNMSIRQPRITFGPFEYNQAYEYWLRQQQAHWLHTEIPMGGDIQDWNKTMSESEQRVIGNTLKGFTQTEVVVGNDYWLGKVHKWFPKPEIQMMAASFGNMETIHAKGYAYLNESLGLEDYEAFLQDEASKAKIDHLVEVKGNSLKDIARSLAIFSAFAEGVQLFSSFAILMHFSRMNKMKGVGQIVAFSVRDESLHSEAGCWLFRQLVAENPDVMDDKLKSDIYEAARAAVKLEDDFIDKVFELGPIENLDPKDLKAFIRHRANTKLADLGLKSNWKNIDADSLTRMEWFDYLTTGVEHQDFFANRVTTYSKGVTTDWESIFND